MTEPRTFIRARKYRLAPTEAQVEKFTQFAGVSRLVYNLALEQRETFWRQYYRAEGCHISWASQSREVTKLRAEFDFIRAVHTDVTTGALRDLDRAFTGFLRGRANYPTYRRKGVNESFHLAGAYASTRKLSGRWSEIRLPGIGWVKYRDTRQLGAIKNLTVSFARGQWFVSAACSVESDKSAGFSEVGIDRGVANAIATSAGDLHRLPATVMAPDKRLRRARKVLSRRCRGSRRYHRQLKRVSALASQVARRRTDWLHKRSTAIADACSVVALEKLNVVGMTASGPGKRGLNRSILNQGWGIFARQLEYKVEERGGLLVYVNPAYSSQTCSACGAVDADNRKSQAVFKCVTCGHEAHADVEAAKEILRRGTALLDVEGSRRRPSEASTERAIA